MESRQTFDTAPHPECWLTSFLFGKSSTSISAIETTTANTSIQTDCQLVICTLNQACYLSYVHPILTHILGRIQAVIHLSVPLKPLSANPPAAQVFRDIQEAQTQVKEKVSREMDGLYVFVLLARFAPDRTPNTASYRIRIIRRI
jgi:hypothetical protein